MAVKTLNEPIRHDLSLARRGRRHEDEPSERPLDWGIIKRLLHYTRPYAAKRNGLLLLVVIRGIQLPTLAWAVGAVINGPITHHDMRGIVWGSCLYALLVLFTQATLHFRQRLALELGESVIQDLRNEVFDRLMRQPMSYFNTTPLGRNISRITSDMEALRMGVQNVLFVTLVQTGQMVGAALFMAYYNWTLFLVVLLLAPVLVGINRYFRNRMSQASRLLQESFSRITASMAETVKGIRVTQGFTRENTNAGIFKRLVEDHAGYNIGMARHVALFIPLLELNTQFFIAMILLIGGYGALQPEWQMPVGDLVTFFFLANIFFDPIKSLGRMYTVAISAMAGAERVFRILDLKPEWEDAPTAADIPRIQGQVEFRDVSFHYEPDKPVLDHVSFTAQAGDSIALVGHTGSGKSTIINLLSKFYLPVSGQILLDGRDLNQITSASLHAQMGLVLQQNFLVSGTIMDNIRMGKLHATDAEVIQAVRDLDCLDLIESMPQGFHTETGEGGSGLSLGQQQLICFARAYLADPRILILDEATSSIDTITEMRLQVACEKLLNGRTSFIVAHRLSTIRRATRIIVLDHGRIIESGTHTQLLKKDGKYAALYEQFVKET